MSGYHGRPAPNFSQYINNLNTIPPYDQDLPGQADDVDFTQDLALFTNAEFNDFDALNMQNGLPFGDLNEERVKRQTSDLGDEQNIKFQDMLADSVPFYPEFAAPLVGIQHTASFSQTNNISPTNASSPVSPASISSATPNLKRKIDSATSPAESPSHSSNIEDTTRVAAEEDKRRRNTAASARFRVKKKQREQALERTVKEAQDKNALLESRMNQLEMENKWLKNLITEKNAATGSAKPAVGDIDEMYRKYKRDSEERDSRKGSDNKKGVGTEN